MKNATRKERILGFLANNPGTHETPEIAKVIGTSVSSASTTLGELTTEGKITKIQRGIYSGNNEGVSIDTQTQFHERRKKFSSDARSAEDNEKTINTLMNTYDEVLALFQSWIMLNIASKDVDFHEQLLFIENFKWLTMIADKLMKRWSLVHVGYDTNTRQAQEDAKAKTAEREKAALEDAPLKDRIVVVGKYDPKAEALIDAIPSSLEEMTDEETEKIKV